MMLMSSWSSSALQRIQTKNAQNITQKKTAETIKANIEKGQKKQKEHYDRRHSTVLCFKKGYMVLKKDFFVQKATRIFSGRVPMLSLRHLAEDYSNLKNCMERRYAKQKPTLLLNVCVQLLKLYDYIRLWKESMDYIWNNIFSHKQLKHPQTKLLL